MLNSKHLAIVRAALTYWDEEMGSESHDVYQHYLHSRDQDVFFTPADVVEVRAYFNDVVQRFGLMEAATGRMLSNPLAEDSRFLNIEPSQKIVCVLIH